MPARQIPDLHECARRDDPLCQNDQIDDHIFKLYNYTRRVGNARCVLRNARIADARPGQVTRRGPGPGHLGVDCGYFIY